MGGLLVDFLERGLEGIGLFMMVVATLHTTLLKHVVAQLEQLPSIYLIY